MFWILFFRNSSPLLDFLQTFSCSVSTFLFSRVLKNICFNYRNFFFFFPFSTSGSCSPAISCNVSFIFSSIRKFPFIFFFFSCEFSSFEVSYSFRCICLSIWSDRCTFLNEINRNRKVDFVKAEGFFFFPPGNSQFCCFTCLVILEIYIPTIPKLVTALLEI